MKRSLILILCLLALLCAGHIHVANAQKSKIFSVVSFGAYANFANPYTLGNAFGTLAAAQAAYPTLPIGQLNMIDLTDPGSGFTSAPTISFSGGSGSGAAATVTVANGGVSHIKITAGGTGYHTAPRITISGGGGTGATAGAYIYQGTIRNIVITAAGTGYTSAPTVSFSGGDGTGATADAYINGITSITITNYGTDYSSAPTVTVNGGGGSGAVLTAVAYDLNSDMNWAGFMAASEAAARFGSGGTVSIPSGAYRLDRMWTVNNTGTLKSINIEGDSRLGTEIRWYGVCPRQWNTLFANEPSIKISLNKGYQLRDLKFINFATDQQATGFLLTGPEPGTQGGNCIWSCVEVEDFETGIRAGDIITGVSASEFTGININLRKNLVGSQMDGGNTEDFTWIQLGIGNNGIGLLFTTANSVHVKGGSATANGIDFLMGYGSCTISGFRSETSGRNFQMGTGTLVMDGCYFVNETDSARQNIQLLGGPFNVTIINNAMEGFIGVSAGNPEGCALLVSNNRIYTDAPLLDTPLQLLTGGGIGGTSVMLWGNRQFGDTDKNSIVGAMPDLIGVAVSGVAPNITFRENFKVTPGDFVTTLESPKIKSAAFASLGTPGDGTIIFCSNCNKATPCTSGGSGAFAKRIAGAWDCD